MTTAYPLQWPHGRPRTARQKQSLFKVTPARAFAEMVDELSKFNATGVVISTNIPTRRDGTPYRDGLSDRIQDPGVAVYFTKNNRQMCLQCDTYLRAWENCRAIGLAVSAFRSMERHGAHQVLNQAFEGFTALPAPGDVSKVSAATWWETLGLDNQSNSLDEINAAYKNQCRAAGGATIELNAAVEAGRVAAQQRADF